MFNNVEYGNWIKNIFYKYIFIDTNLVVLYRTNKFKQKVLRDHETASFQSVNELCAAIEAFVEAYQLNAKPFL